MTAIAGIGPPPKAQPVRRNARVGPVMLPAEGRKGAAPKWPLPEAASAAERDAWQALWATPQAVIWERLGWTRLVARYCVVMVAAERRNASAALLGQAVVLEDRLGLSPRAMRTLLWDVAPDEVAERRDENRASARGRIKAVG